MILPGLKSSLTLDCPDDDTEPFDPGWVYSLTQDLERHQAKTQKQSDIYRDKGVTYDLYVE